MRTEEVQRERVGGGEGGRTLIQSIAFLQCEIEGEGAREREREPFNFTVF